MKQQRRVATSSGVVGGEGENDNQDEAEMDNNEFHDERHLSRKERQKAAKQAEKEERKLFEEERRRQQREAQEVAQKEKKERDRLEAQRIDEERRVRQEQRQAKEFAEYEAWKTFLKSPGSETTLTVHEWIEELKENKLIHVDDLAKRFSISSEDVRKRIQLLLDSSRVTGVLEPDGRFIYISPRDLSAIASFVLKQDKISLQDLTIACNKIINE